MFIFILAVGVASGTSSFVIDAQPASHKSFVVDSAILSGMDCCAACEFFDGYLCRGEESPLYKRDVDPKAKCPSGCSG